MRQLNRVQLFKALAKCAVLWHVSHYLQGVHPKFGLLFHKYPKMDHDMPPGVCN